MHEDNSITLAYINISPCIYMNISKTLHIFLILTYTKHYFYQPQPHMIIPKLQNYKINLAMLLQKLQDYNFSSRNTNLIKEA